MDSRLQIRSRSHPQNREPSSIIGIMHRRPSDNAMSARHICKHRPLADFFARSKTYSSMDLAPPGVVRRCPTPLSMQGYPQCLWSLKLEGPPICPTIYKSTRGNEQGILSGSGHAVRHLFRSLRRSEASVKYKRPSNSRSSSAYPRSYTWRSHDVNPHLASILAMSQHMFSRPSSVLIVTGGKPRGVFTGRTFNFLASVMTLMSDVTLACLFVQPGVA